MNIKEFLTTKPYAPKTRESYTRILERFKNDLVVSSSSPDAPGLIAWLDAQSTWGGSMRWMAFSAIRAYLRAAYGDQHPALKARVKRDKAGPGRFFDRDIVKRLYELWPDSDIGNIRNRALCAFMLNTGLRRAEVCRVELSRINLAARSGTVLCKGGQWGAFFFSNHTHDLLCDWITARRSVALPGNRYLWVAVGGLHPGAQLTPQGLKAIVRSWGQKLDIPLSPHDFRRSFCVQSLKAGAPSRVVQLAGRWNRIDMVELYSRGLEASEIQKYLPSLSPEDD